MVTASSRNKVALPARPFFYTLDQIAVILDIEYTSLLHTYIFLDQRSIGAKGPGRMMARNIAEPDQKPEWRVAEQEFIRWLKYRGFRFYERDTVRF